MPAFTLPVILLRFIGIAALGDFLSEALDAALMEQRRGKWWVVSVVEYGEILEWRTPHWRVAIRQLADDIEFDISEQQDMLNVMVAGGSLRKETVQRLATRIKRLIIANELVDTGNYLGSIAIGPSLGEALVQSESQLIDPETSVFTI